MSYLFYDTVVSHLREIGLSVQDADTMRPWAGSDADACYDNPDCPNLLWDHDAGGTLLIVLGIGQSGATFIAAIALLADSTDTRALIPVALVLSHRDPAVRVTAATTLAERRLWGGASPGDAANVRRLMQDALLAQGGAALDVLPGPADTDHLGGVADDEHGSPVAAVGCEIGPFRPKSGCTNNPPFTAGNPARRERQAICAADSRTFIL